MAFTVRASGAAAAAAAARPARRAAAARAAAPARRAAAKLALGGCSSSGSSSSRGELQVARAVAGGETEDVVFDSNPAAEKVTGRHYEICYLISPDNSQEALQEVIVKYKSMIEEQGGTIHRLEDWGRRPLAYAIKGKLDANYVLMNFEVDPEALTEFNTELNKDEKVIRFMTFSRKEAISEPSPMLGGLA